MYLMRSSCRDQVTEAVRVVQSLLDQLDQMEQIVTIVRDALLDGHTVYTCGNGGSATDAIHLAEEFVGRYRSNRRPLPVVCLNTDPGALTCIANDFGYEEVFSRQLAALSRAGDVLVCFSTSGNSPNLLAALEVARERGVISIALLGKDGGQALGRADHALVVNSNESARIQEAHTLILHTICEECEAHTLER